MPEASRIVALLGPTNTGKTHRAIERMLEHESGMIGLPLRLLAREVYDRITSRIGRDQVALVTGEEKIVPPRARYFVATVEAMPVHKDLEFVAIDEVQLAAHRERGHVFTDRLLHARGTRETWLLGSDTMRPLVRTLVPTAQLEEHPRLSRLSYAGPSKLARVPPRSAVVAFSMDKVYEVAERLRAMKGGAAVVLGALSPRTRNAQVAMFQAGEVDYIVATDAIGMGLNLELAHVAFAGRHKFDGRELRELEDAELGQIAGRAGRYVKDGTFGTVAPIELPASAILAVEHHRFAPVRRLRFRPHILDFTSTAALLGSLHARPPHPALIPVERTDDAAAFERLASLPDVRRLVTNEETVHLLWEVASVPDFRKLLFEAYVEDLRRIFVELATRGRIGDDLLAEMTRPLASDSGDVEVLLGRIAALRTWSYVAHKDTWVAEAAHWQAETRVLEDRLSDALHTALTRRFVAEIGKKKRVPRAATSGGSGGAGKIGELDRPALAPGHPFAQLAAMVVPDRASGPIQAPSALEDLIDAPHEAFTLRPDGTISAGEEPLARLAPGSRASLPGVRLLDRTDVAAGLRSRLERRLLAFARDDAARLLAPIEGLSRGATPTVRGLGHLLEEGLGTVLARDASALVEALTAEERVLLAQRRIVIGRCSVHAIDLVKPRAIDRRALLLRVAGKRVPTIAPGRTSLRRQGGDDAVFVALGYVPLGPRVVRADVAERLVELARGEQAHDRTNVATMLGCSVAEATRVMTSVASS